MNNKSINNVYELRLRIAELKFASLEKERNIKSGLSEFKEIFTPSNLIEKAIDSISAKSGFPKSPLYRLMQLGIAFGVEKWFFRNKSKTFQNTAILTTQGLLTFLSQFKGEEIIEKFKNLTEKFNFKTSKKKENTSRRVEDDNDYLGI
jgi:hypothetical protein